jgi:hypothetical protein
LERVRKRDRANHIPVSDERVLEINRRAATVRLAWDIEVENTGDGGVDLVVAEVAKLLRMDSGD